MPGRRTATCSLALAATLAAGLPLIGGLTASVAADPTPTDPRLAKIGTYDSGDRYAGAEIAAFGSNRLFITNGATNTLDVVDASDPTNPTLITSIDITPYGPSLQSVDVKGSLVAVAVQGATKTAPGSVVFFDTNGTFVAQKTVGALPDMVTFTPDGTKVLTANEGEPRDYCAPQVGETALDVDPEGSISIIDVSGGAASATVSTAGFTAYNGTEAALRAQNIRIYGPNATAAQDLEPEYITVSGDSSTAYVTLQENNALATVNLATASVSGLASLGYKDHNAAGNGLDPSDRDGPSNGPLVNIVNRPVQGMYQPDAIASFTSGSDTYLVTANEGDAREWACFNGGTDPNTLEAEDRRAGASPGMDPTVFAGLTGNAQLGRLSVTTRFPATTNGSNQFTSLYSLGGRSFSIRDTAGNLVFDSGDDIEQIVAAQLPSRFNTDFSDSSGTVNGLDSRSDNKGPEPEGVTVGSAYGTTYAFVGLERAGGIMVFDLATPASPRFVQWINTTDYAGDIDLGTAGDVSPEGLEFVPAADSPTGKPLVIAAYELSGTTAIFELTDTATISGSVTAEGGGPLAGATVGLYSSTATGRLQTATTDAGGNYSFEVAPGSYRVKASAGGHQAEWFADAPAYAGGTDIVVVPSDVADRDLALTPLSSLGSIGGTVSTTGGPLAGATVGVYRPAGGLVALDTTDAAGAYEVGALSPGSYLVKLTAPGHVTEWSDESRTAALAAPVNVSAGVVTPLDEQLSPLAEALEIGGTVTSGGSPVAGAAVRLYDANGFVGVQVLTDGTGSYGFPLVNPTVTYYVRFSATGYANVWFDGAATFASGADPISQPAGGSFTADASLSPVP
jgi:hypothetical protein